MMLKHAIAAAVVCGALGSVGAAPASAMPVDNLAIKVPGQVEKAAVVCTRRGCFWVPSRRHHRWWYHRHRRW